MEQNGRSELGNNANAKIDISHVSPSPSKPICMISQWLVNIHIIGLHTYSGRNKVLWLFGQMSEHSWVCLVMLNFAQSCTSYSVAMRNHKIVTRHGLTPWWVGADDHQATCRWSSCSHGFSPQNRYTLYISAAFSPLYSLEQSSHNIV